MDWFNDSKLFKMARQGQRLTHVAAVIPLSLAFLLLSQTGAIPLVIVLLFIYGANGLNINFDGVSALLAGFWMALLLITSFAWAYLIVWAWVRLFEQRPFRTLGYETKNAPFNYARGFFFGALMFSAAVGILALFGGVSFEQGDPAKQGVAALGGVLLVLFGWIVQGGAEEIVMRGWVLPVVGARHKPWIGLLVSSLVFSIMHGLNPGLSLIALINLALFGVFAGLYAMREGSLWGISALHSVWNWVQGNFFGFQVSGTIADGGTLINLTETGQAWLTGGVFGPEGGLAVTAVLIVGILVVLFWKTNDKEEPDMTSAPDGS